MPEMARQYEAHDAKIRGIFRDIARIYDPMNRVITLGLWGSWQRHYLDLVNPAAGERCLDIATGTGDLAVRIAKRQPSSTVVGLDLSAEMLAVARRKIALQGLSDRIALVEGNALQLPFSDGSFDVITVGFGLRNFPDLAQALSEMRRVLRPGGRALSLEVSRPEGAVAAFGFRTFFYGVVPRLGRLVGRSGRAYAWLPQSHRRFPGRAQLEELFRSAGFGDVASWPLTMGAVAIHRGYRQP